ncbi:MAG: rRNA pseudouridine synthase [Deltaproteobacteria bacterium]|nr:rRNA pseudouridine synthase [Deltaproteobacteria bacterium]
MALERIQKILAHAGVASRRAAEELILNGRVRVNGRTIKTLGTKADAWRDKIEVDNRVILEKRPVYYLFHKPRGVVTTLDDPEKRPSVSDYLKKIPERVYPVGRLDFNTSGVLLLTNDGAMTQALLHPKKKVPKTYLVKFKGELQVDELDALRNGVTLDDGGKTAKAELFVRRRERGYTWVEITIFEGKNRQIHRMGEAIDHRVSQLSRIAFAGLTIQDLRPGQSRALKTKEIERLRRGYLNPAKRVLGQSSKKRNI